MWLPLQQDLRRWSVGEGGWGCEQGRGCGVGALELGDVRRRWQEGEVERVRRWRRRLPGLLGLAWEGAGEAPILWKRCCRGLEIGGLFHEAWHIGSDVGRDGTDGPDVGGRGDRAMGRGPGNGHRGRQGRVSREGFNSSLGGGLGGWRSRDLSRPSWHMLDMGAGRLGGSSGGRLRGSWGRVVRGWAGGSPPGGGRGRG